MKVHYSFGIYSYLIFSYLGFEILDSTELTIICNITLSIKVTF